MADLAVFHATHRVGTIEPQDGGLAFIYDPGWLRGSGAFPLSLRMPLSALRVPPSVFEPWIAGLLPEGAQRQALARQLGTATEDTLGLLAQAGGDTAGALSFGRLGSESSDGWSPVCDETTLERIVNDLPRRPLAAGEAGVSTTLAGARSKLPVAIRADGHICLPGGGAPSTHILKPDAEQLVGGVQNEALCMVLARRCGLDAPQVTCGRAGSRSYLLITRYDRLERGGHWHRLHQEGFAQALGLSPATTREAGAGTAGGSTLAGLLALTRHAMRAPDVLALIDRLILDVLLCNPAPPASNVSLMLADDGVRLAPAYGLACMAAWDGISPKLERMISGAAIDRPHWAALAADCGLNAARLLARVEALAGAVLANVREAAEAVAAMPAGPHPLLARLVVAIEARARRHRAIAERYPVMVRRKPGAGRKGLPPMLTVVSSGG